MRIVKGTVLAIFFLLMLLHSGVVLGQDVQWEKKFKGVRQKILLFDTAVNGHYDAVLKGRPGDREVDRMINSSIAAKQAVNELSVRPEEYKEEYRILQEIYRLIRQKELMAENKEAASDQVEKWKTLKKRVDDLFDELQKLLN